MSETSAILNLPYIQPAQAQKHVTHNEAIRVLDALVQLSVLDETLLSPPAAPNRGDAYILPPLATGVWAGNDAAIAVYEDSTWTFINPLAGWRAHVISSGTSIVFDGATWAAPTIAPDLLGINTTADATNRLSISSPATLLSHEGAGHQVKVNKAGVSDTASLLFQTNWSGRAEMGLAGDDSFSIKVSADGTIWSDALVFDPATGIADGLSGATIRH